MHGQAWHDQDDHDIAAAALAFPLLTSTEEKLSACLGALRAGQLDVYGKCCPDSEGQCHLGFSASAAPLVELLCKVKAAHTQSSKVKINVHCVHAPAQLQHCAPQSTKACAAPCHLREVAGPSTGRVAMMTFAAQMVSEDYALLEACTLGLRDAQRMAGDCGITLFRPRWACAACGALEAFTETNQQLPCYPPCRRLLGLG